MAHQFGRATARASVFVPRNDAFPRNPQHLIPASPLSGLGSATELFSRGAFRFQSWRSQRKRGDEQ